MADPVHLAILRDGVETWNAWRAEYPETAPDLCHTDLRGFDLARANLTETGLVESILDGKYLSETDFSRAYLQRANLHKTNLFDAKLVAADLRGATLAWAYVERADFSQADLRSTSFVAAQFYDTRLTGADLQGANLSFSRIVRTNLDRAKLTGAHVYGISVWDTSLEDAEQKDLIITELAGHGQLTADNIEIAQFLHLMLRNAKLRDTIDTIARKVVLILGRFTTERKAILDALRDELRQHNYVPVMFDFEVPSTRDCIETVTTLAHLCRFVIADFTDPKIVLEEVPHIVRMVAVPVAPIMLRGSGPEPVTLRDLRVNHRSVLGTHVYENQEHLLQSLVEQVIGPAEAKAAELAQSRRELR